MHRLHGTLSQSRSAKFQQLVSQSLYQLIGAFVVRHWRAYIASALMLIGIAVLTVWVPRVVGQAVDGLVAGTLHGAALMRELVSLLIMGSVIYLLRVGWRLQLFSAAYQLGVELRHACMTGSRFRARRFSIAAVPAI